MKLSQNVDELPRCLTTCTLLDCSFSLYSQVHQSFNYCENMESQAYTIILKMILFILFGACVAKKLIIRIFNVYEMQIENSVTRVTVWYLLLASVTQVAKFSVHTEQTLKSSVFTTVIFEASEFFRV